MARKQIRQIIENPKVAFTNFGRGMEFNTHSKAAFNNRVQMIKNLDITDDGKLELRKPVLPYIDKDGYYPAVLLENDYEVIQVLHYPVLKFSKNPFVWLVREKKTKDAKEFFIHRNGVHSYTKLEHDTTLYGKTEGFVDVSYLSYADALFIKFKNGVCKLSFDTAGSLQETSVSQYNPNGFEIANVGINLFNKHPLQIHNKLIVNTNNRIDSLIFSVESDNNHKILQAKPDPKPTDFLYLKSRIEISNFLLTKELELIKGIDAKELSPEFLAKNKNIDKTKTMFPKFTFLTQAPGGSKKQRSVYMPLFILTEGVDLSLLSQKQKDQLIKIRSEVVKYWSSTKRGDILTIGRSADEHTKYGLLIEYDSKFTHGSEWVDLSDTAASVDVSKWSKWGHVPSFKDTNTALSVNNQVLTLSGAEASEHASITNKGTYLNFANVDLKIDKNVDIYGIKVTTHYGIIAWNSHIGSHKKNDYHYTVEVDRLVENPKIFYNKPLKYNNIVTNKIRYNSASTASKSSLLMDVKLTSGESLNIIKPTYNNTKFNIKQFDMFSGINYLDKLTDINSRTHNKGKFWITNGGRVPSIKDTNVNGGWDWWIGSSYDYWSQVVLDKGFITSKLKKQVTHIPIGTIKQQVGTKEIEKHISNIILKFPIEPKSATRNMRWVGGVFGGYRFYIDTVSFETVVLDSIEVEISKSQAPDLVEFHNTILKYSSVNDKSLKFEWELQNTKHLFTYWEKLGLYGYDRNVQKNYPYNYVFLSEPDNLSYFPNTRISEVYSQDNHIITSVLPWKNNLLAFTENSTTMFIGTDLSKKETISTIRGMPEFNSRTAKVVSNSVVFLTGDEVVAFVPAPATDNAASLNTRVISKQIEPYVRELNRRGPKSVFAENYKHEYWLFYQFDNSTIVLKYSWDKFAWTIAEYNNYSFVQVFGLGADDMVAVDKLGHLYNLSSINIETNLNKILSALSAEDHTHYPTGTQQDIPGMYRDVLLSEGGHIKLKPDHKDVWKEIHLSLPNPDGKYDPRPKTHPYPHGLNLNPVYDGDTFKDDTGQSYRLLGVDAPEEHTLGATKSWADKAREFTRDALLSNDTSKVEVALTGNKTYKRLVAKVRYTKNGIVYDLATELIKAALVRKAYISGDPSSKWYYPGETYRLQLTDAQTKVSNAKQGIWADNVNLNEIYEHAAFAENNLIMSEWNVTFNEYDYEFQLGPRLPSIDTSISLDDASVLVGNDSNHPIPNQHFTIHVDGQLMGDHLINVKGKTTAIMHASPQQKWSFGISNYQRPAPSKHTQKVRRIATTIDVGVKGKSPNKLFIDSVVFRYRNTDRKRK